MSSFTPGLVAWELAFQKSPIIFSSGGILSSLPGAMLPVLAITEAINLPLGLLTGGGNVGMDSFFANFRPLPGATVVNNDIAMYPFANQQVAANAIIAQPTQISYLMTAPANQELGYVTKLAIMTALISAFKLHSQSGGMFICATPSWIYTNCLLLKMSDASVGGTNQVQNSWQLDFIKPLVTTDDAQSAQNGLMSILSSGAPTDATGWSGLGTSGATQGGLAGPSVIPSGSPALAANTAGSNPLVQGAFAAPTGTTVTAGPSMSAGAFSSAFNSP